MKPFDDIVVCAPVTVPYTRNSSRGAAWFMAQVLRQLLDAGGLQKHEIDGLCLASFTLAPDGPPAFAQYVGLSPRHLDGIPTGGAAGVMALRRAARAVQCGDADIVACMAADTQGPGVFAGMLKAFSTASRDFVWPYGAAGPNGSFALLTEHYMRITGATRHDFGKLCVAQRQWAQRNPLALLQKDLTLDAYLAARPIADPIHLFDCVMPCAGGEGFLVMGASRAARLGLRGVSIGGVIERHNAYPDDPVQFRGGWAVDRARLWNSAGIGPEDVDLVQTYDDYPVISMIQFEGLGFCPENEAPAFVRRTTFGPDGMLPHNTSGGQLSAGQAGAAGGFLGLTEAIRQLTGQAGARQVDRAHHAVVSGFGMINYDRGLCTSAVVLRT